MREKIKPLTSGEFWAGIGWLRAEAPRAAAALAPAYEALRWSWAQCGIPDEKKLLTRLYKLIGHLIKDYEQQRSKDSGRWSSSGGLTVGVWRDRESRAIQAEIGFLWNSRCYDVTGMYAEREVVGNE